MKLDFKKFKKTHEDEHSATLTHEHGHTIKIAKKALNKPLQEQLSAIPMMNEGGEAKEPKKTPTPAPQMLDPVKTQEVQDSMRKAFHFADASPENNVPDINQPVDISADIPQASLQAMQSQKALPTQEEINMQQAQQTASALGAAPESTLATELPKKQEPQNIPLNAPPQQANLNKVAAQTQSAGLTQGIQEQKAGLMGEAEALGQQGQREAQAAQQQVSAQNKLISDANKHFTALAKEREAVQNDYMNGHIDPNHFMNSRSDLSKVSTAIGLILGGIGGALTGQENPALKFLNAQIDRDIDAQKTEMNKKHNVLGALQQQFGNIRDASEMMRMMQSDVYSAKLKQAAALTTDPLAKARALQAAGKLDQDTIPMMTNLAQRQAILANPGTVSPAQTVQFLVPEKEQPKALEEIKQQENIEHQNKNAIDSFNQIEKLQTAASRLTSPIQSHKQIDALWNPVIDKVTKTNEGRVTPITVDMISVLKPELTDSTETRNLKRQKFINLLNSERSTPTLDAYGVNLKKGMTSPAPNPNVMRGYGSTRK